MKKEKNCKKTKNIQIHNNAHKRYTDQDKFNNIVVVRF